MPHISRKLFFVVATAICFFHFGCGSSDDVGSGWSVGDDSSFPYDVTATAPTDPDTGGSDAGLSFDSGYHSDSNLDRGSDTRGGVSKPDTEPADLPNIGTCSGEPEVAKFTLSGPPKPMSSAFAPRIANGLVYFHKVVDGISQIFAQRAGSGDSRQLTHEKFDIWLEEAASDYFVAHTRVSETNRRDLLDVRDETGASLARIVELGVVGLRESGFSGAPSRSFDGERLVTWGADALYFGRDGRQLGEIDVTPDHAPQSAPIVMSSGSVAYAASYVTQFPPQPVEVSPSDVFVWTPQQGVIQVTRTPADEDYVWSDGGNLFWQTDEGIYIKQADSESSLLHGGSCGPPHAAHGLVAFACADGADETLKFNDRDELPVTNALYLSDGRHTREIVLDGERAMLHSVRVGERGVAWFEFDASEALCQGGETGRVMYFDFATGRQVQLGEVIAPCWCCNADYSTLSLDIEKGVVAWSNAGSLEEAFHDPEFGHYVGGLAYATVELPSACEDD